MADRLKDSPNHARQRQVRIYEDLSALAKLVSGLINTDLLQHDIRSDVHHLVRAAERWEDYCRKSGQSPYTYANEDGTPDITKVEESTKALLWRTEI